MADHGTRARLGEWYADLGTQLVRRQDRVPMGIVYALPTRGYALAQIDVGARQLALGRQRFTVALTVQNALNARYRDYLSRYRLFVNDPGRDVVVRVTTGF